MRPVRALAPAPYDAELDEGVARLRAFLDAALDGVVVVDADGRITEFNRAAERMFGYEAGAALVVGWRSCSSRSGIVTRTSGASAERF
jgi:PAS domain-containing protein